MIAASVYVLCAITSVVCAVLLLLKYRSNKARLLLWSGLCFCGLALNNILLFVDVVVMPRVDLSVIRSVPALVGIVLLIWGFIWDSR